MSERYKKVFSLEKQFYCPGAPVIIQAGALLKDNQTGNIIAQVKFKSISPKVIKALFVKISAKDISGADIAGVDNFQYLDLNVRRDTEFGSKNPIVLPDAVARSFFCECVSAVFQDGTSWTCEENAIWTELTAAVPLEETIDPKLIGQYERDIGLAATYTVTDHQDLWYCTCGAINLTEEDSCHHCQAEKSALLAALNTDKLTANKQEFDAAQEAAAAAQKAAEEEAAHIRAKKNKNIALTVISIISSIALFVTILLTVIIPNKNYKNAIALMDEEKYSEAIVAFEELNGYKDSASYIETIEKIILDNAKTYYLNGDANRAVLYLSHYTITDNLRAAHSVYTYITRGDYSTAVRKGQHNLVIPKSETYINEIEFNNCYELTSVTMYDGVAAIGSGAFKNCTNLTSITLPVSIVTIRSNAFENCDNLTSITYAGTVEQWKRISLDYGWNGADGAGKIPATTVVCSNGTVSIP